MQKIKVNLIPSGLPVACYSSQYDEGRVIRCELYNGLQPYTLQENDVVTLNLRKPDNHVVTATLNSTAGNKYVDLVTSEQMTAVFGVNKCLLKITNTGIEVGTAEFVMFVQKDVIANGDPSESVIEGLQQMVEDILSQSGAEAIGYDNSESGLEADNVQEAIDKLAQNPSVNAYTKQETDSFLANEYNATQTYSVGDYCIYNGALYVCNTAISTAEAWNLAHWTLTNVGTALESIPTKTSQLQNDNGFAQIDDAEASASKTYSSEKINTLLGNKADENEVTEIKTITIEQKKSVNLLDINTIIRGTLSWNGQLVEDSGADYYVTPFIDAEKDNFIHYVTSGNETTIQRISLYKSDKTFISNVNSQSNYEITDSNVKFVRLQLYKTVINPIRAMVCVTNSNITPSFEWCYKPYTKVIGTRQEVHINATDGIVSFWEKMQEAFYRGNCDVYIHKGEYIYTNEIIDKIRSLNRRGVPVGNNCHYYFETGANITCEYTGNNTSDVAGYFSPLDSWNIASDFEIYNLTLSSKNTVYAIHDEANGEETAIKHIYKDCYVSIDNTALGESSSALSKCIGGGFGLHSEIIIDNCVFSTINPNTEHGEDVSYHKANNQTYTDAKVVVSGCYFGGSFRCDMDYSPIPSIVPRVIACGNSALGISAYQCEAKIWNNTIRT